MCPSGLYPDGYLYRGFRFCGISVSLTHGGGYGLKSFSTFAVTAASILMSGGQGRLKPSPGIFFVASMPSLLPLAISLVAWSSTSAFIVAADVSRLTLLSVEFTRVLVLG